MKKENCKSTYPLYYYHIIEKIKKMGKNIYKAKITRFPNNPRIDILSTSDILKMGEDAFDNINISGKTIYFVESKYNKKIEEKKEERRVQLKELREKEKIKKEDYVNKEKIEAIKNPKNKYERIQNYIINIKNIYGYLNPNIEIKLYTRKEIEDLFYDSENKICYLNFEKNWKEVFDEYLKEEKDEKYLLKDLEDFDTDAFLNAKDCKNDFSSYTEYIKFLCKEVVKVLSKAKGYYPYIPCTKEELFKYNEIVYLKSCYIVSYNDDIEVPFCSEITHIDMRAFDLYPSKRNYYLKECKKVKFKLSKDNKLNIEYKKHLKDISTNSPVIDIVFE